MVAKVFLDTETSGLDLSEGHRVIEIGATVVEHGMHTGKEFHELLDPERDVDREATEVHGFTRADLLGKPKFSDVVDRFVEFIEGKDVYIHNAHFDTSFLNGELQRINYMRSMEDICTIHDTMDVAKEKHRGGLINLDTLCNKYGVDKSERDKHGALLDAQLLSEVYLRMMDSEDDFLGMTTKEQQTKFAVEHIDFERTSPKVIFANQDELDAHQTYLSKIQESSDS